MIVETDLVLQAKLNLLKSWLLIEHPLFLRLYVNNADPDPADISPGLFVEASYSGYAPVGIFDSFSDAQRESTGVWRIVSGPHQFPANQGSAAYQVSGWFITRNNWVCWAEQFPQLLPIPVGGSPPPLLLRITEEAKTVVIRGLTQ